MSRRTGTIHSSTTAPRRSMPPLSDENAAPSSSSGIASRTRKSRDTTLPLQSATPVSVSRGMDTKRSSTRRGAVTTTTTRVKTARQRQPFAEVDENRRANRTSNVNTTSSIQSRMVLEAVEIISGFSGKPRRLDPATAAAVAAVASDDLIPPPTALSLPAKTDSKEHQKVKEEKEPLVSVAEEPQIDDIAVAITRTRSPLASPESFNKQEEGAPILSEDWLVGLPDGLTSPSSSRRNVPDLTLADLEPLSHHNHHNASQTYDIGHEIEDEEEDEPLVLRRRAIPTSLMVPLRGRERSPAGVTHGEALFNLADEYSDDSDHDDDDPFGFASAERKVGKALTTNVLAVNEQKQQQREKRRYGALGSRLPLLSAKQRLLNVSLDSPVSTTSTASEATSSSSSSSTQMVDAAKKTLIPKGTLQASMLGTGQSAVATTTRRGMTLRGGRQHQQRGTSQMNTLVSSTSSTSLNLRVSSDAGEEQQHAYTTDVPSSSSNHQTAAVARRKGRASTAIVSPTTSKAIIRAFQEEESLTLPQKQTQGGTVEAGKPPTPNRKGVKRYMMSTQLEAMLPRPKRRTTRATRRRIGNKKEVEDEAEDSGKDEDEDGNMSESYEDEEEENNSDGGDQDLVQVHRRGGGRSTRSNAKAASAEVKGKRALSSSAKIATTKGTAASAADPSVDGRSKLDKGKGKARADDDRNNDKTQEDRPNRKGTTTTAFHRHRRVPKLTAEEQAEAKSVQDERKAYFEEVDLFEFDVEYTR